MRGFWILFLFLGFLLISKAIHRNSLNRLLKAMKNAVYQQKDEELFSLYVDSPQAKMLMSETARQVMKLKAWTALDRPEKVCEQLTKLKSKRLTRKDRLAVLQIAFGYLVEKRLKPEAQALLQETKAALKEPQNPAEALALFDCELVFDVYLEPEISREHDLKILIDSAPDPQSQAVYQYRLAIVKNREKKREECIALLKQARENSLPSDQRKIDQILNGAWELL